MVCLASEKQCVNFPKPIWKRHCFLVKRNIMEQHQRKEHRENNNLAHEDRQEHVDQSIEDNKDLEDNDLQGGLTGESEDEEDVSGDLAGNAAGNPED
jgi:hypothetical protein